MTILHIDSSARINGSISRDLTSRIIAKLGSDVIRRDLQNGEPLLTENWVNANFTPVEDRTEAQRDELKHSDALVAELAAADTVVIGLPVYNFGMPAALKSWVDMIARAGVTFRYTDNGPEGLLSGKRAIVAFAAGGVTVGAPVDYASTHLRQVLNFVGITDITIITASEDPADTTAQIEALVA